MRTVFIAVFLTAMLLNLVGYFILPDHVAIHFGRGGKPDSWASKEVNLIAFTIIEIILFLVFLIPPYLVTVIPIKHMNLPNKDYWTSTENIATTKHKLAHLMSEFGIATFALVIFAGTLTVDANLSEPVRLNESVLLAGLAIYLAYTVWWCIKLFLSFKVPKPKDVSQL